MEQINATIRTARQSGQHNVTLNWPALQQWSSTPLSKLYYYGFTVTLSAPNQITIRWQS